MCVVSRPYGTMCLCKDVWFQGVRGELFSTIFEFAEERIFVIFFNSCESAYRAATVDETHATSWSGTRVTTAMIRCGYRKKHSGPAPMHTYYCVPSSKKGGNPFKINRPGRDGDTY